MIAIPNMNKPVFCGHCRLVELHSDGELICSVTRTPIVREGMNDDCPLIEIGDIEYQAYKEFRTMLLKKIEERILYGERGNDEKFL